MSLYKHQQEGIDFLVKRPGAGLFFDMGTGKTRTALLAAVHLHGEHKIKCVLVLCPAATKISWWEEIEKLNAEKLTFSLGRYDAKTQQLYFTRSSNGTPLIPIVIVSYALLPQKRHTEALAGYFSDALMICDESSFLKSRTAKQTRSAQLIRRAVKYCWLLTGTPVANGPLDLWAQGLVMFGGVSGGALRGFKNWYHFRARYGVLGGYMGRQIVAFQNVPELTKRFAPYVLRREKRDCLDLPPKTYTVREIALTEDTWRVYQEMKREALLALPNEALRPEPNAAVRLLRLCQLTSGHVGMHLGEQLETLETNAKDVSSEKLDWLVEELTTGELSSIEAIIIWTRWRRERERLQTMLASHAGEIKLYRIFGGQSPSSRSCEVQGFQTSTNRRVLVGQVRAGGYGLNLTAASTVVYLSNTFSYIDRVQSEDRVHRISQKNPCLYLDVLATGPKGQKSVDHHILECLKRKEDVATLTCASWRRILVEE